MATWNDFNKTVGGRLISTVPLAAVCHNDQFEAYDANACESLKANWFFPETHLPSSSSVMAALFTNNSCNPFLPREFPCTLGNYVNYAVKIQHASDAKKTLAFAKKHHIRLVIRNTGHDYNGKSTGAGALAVWTQNLKSIELLEEYSRPWYKGRALKIDAGVSVNEAYKFADAHQATVVGGNCPTVGIAGGLAQGSGHSPLATKFGLVADQVLEWEVLTAAGEVVTANPSSHEDLYWALCGGGPGTYGLVLSMTAKLHPSISVSSAKLSFALPSTTTGIESFWEAVKTFAESLPEMVDRGLQVTWTLVPGVFLVSPATAPELSKHDLDELFRPTLKQLTRDGIPYQYQSEEFSTFLASYEAMILPGSNVSDSILGGQLLPRSVVEDDIEEFISTLRTITEANYVFAGLSLDVSRVPAHKTAAHPYWRKTLISAVLGTFYDYQDFEANLKNQRYMTDTLIPKLAAFTGGKGAAYVNEANFLQPHWQDVLYGEHFGRLSSIKRKYDPNGIFYALGAVGSDSWVQKRDGRLCRA